MSLLVVLEVSIHEVPCLQRQTTDGRLSSLVVQSQFGIQLRPAGVHGWLQVAATGTAVSETDIFASSTCHRNIVTLVHVKILIVRNTGPCDVEIDLARSKAWMGCPRQCGCQAYKNDVYLSPTERANQKYLAKSLCLAWFGWGCGKCTTWHQFSQPSNSEMFFRNGDFLVLATWRSDSALSSESSNRARQWHSIRVIPHPSPLFHPSDTGASLFLNPPSSRHS